MAEICGIRAPCVIGLRDVVFAIRGRPTATYTGRMPRSPNLSSVHRRAAAAAALAFVAAAAACTGTNGSHQAVHSAGPPTVGPVGIPRPAHVVVVVMENKSAEAIVGAPQAPYINTLIRHAALFTNSHAIGHPSQPNYLALFSGSTQRTTSDSCPQSFAGPNLGQELIRSGRTFAAYSEGLPTPGYTGCSIDEYARKHAPWTDFTNLPRSVGRPYGQFRPGATLPTVSFVIPNVCHDMHSCSVATGDRWLSVHLPLYLRWAQNHDSLLILTWDEAHGSSTNQIATIFAGPMVKPGRYGQRITHYTVLRTIEDMYRLPHAGSSRQPRPITGVWTNAARG